MLSTCTIMMGDISSALSSCGILRHIATKTQHGWRLFRSVWCRIASNSSTKYATIGERIVIQFSDFVELLTTLKGQRSKIKVNRDIASHPSLVCWQSLRKCKDSQPSAMMLVCRTVWRQLMTKQLETLWLFWVISVNQSVSQFIWRTESSDNNVS